jgi:hypothetical protein
MSYPYRRRSNLNEINRLRRSPINIIRNNNVAETSVNISTNANSREFDNNNSISYNNNEDNDVFRGYENTFNSSVLFNFSNPLWNPFIPNLNDNSYEESENYIDERNDTTSPILANFIFNMIEDMNLEYVMEQSLNEQPTLEKTENIINVSSQLYSTVENKFDTKDCSICLCDFEKSDMVSKLNCHHLFHNECIVEWGKYKSECPKCKSNI